MELTSFSIFPPKLRVRHCAGHRPSSSSSAIKLPINNLGSGTSLPNDAGDGRRPKGVEGLESWMPLLSTV